MKKILKFSSVLFFVLQLIFAPILLKAQQNELLPKNIKLGPITGDSKYSINNENLNDLNIPPDYNITSATVKTNGVAIQRLYFDDVNLGHKSFLLIQSKLDKGLQRFDENSIKEWGNGSAYFNGDEVIVYLCAATNESDIRVTVNAVYSISGKIQNAGGISQPASICNGADDRVASSDNRIGRLLPGICTGWQISNGAFLTAGHCFNLMQIYELNVPSSTNDGLIIAANPNDQYPIVQSSIAYENSGPGDDWCVFKVNANSTTGLLPYQNAANANTFNGRFFRCSWELLPSTSGNTTRITGFGKDSIPLGSSGHLNSSTFTDQTSVGTFDSKSGSGSSIKLEYVVDTEGGNSGSPIIMDGTNTTIGIHTYGDCPSNGTNGGTSFDAQDLENTINNFLGAGNIFVDANHPSVFTFGSVMNPYHTVSAAVSAASSGSDLNIVEGAYAESVVINKTLTIKAPVGMVVIGPNAVLLNAQRIEPDKKAGLRNVFDKNRISIAPNPANDYTTLKINNADSKISLKIYNSTMQLVKALNYESGIENKISTNDLSPGIYFIDIQINSESCKIKLVISR